MNPTVELPHQHRSILKFTHQQISSDLFEAVLRTGQCAATSSHLQTYTLIHVTDMAKREVLTELTGRQKYVADASDFLVFCADMKLPSEAVRNSGADAVSGITEQLLVASVELR